MNMVKKILLIALVFTSGITSENIFAADQRAELQRRIQALEDSKQDRFWNPAMQANLDWLRQELAQMQAGVVDQQPRASLCKHLGALCSLCCGMCYDCCATCCNYGVATCKWGYENPVACAYGTGATCLVCYACCLATPVTKPAAGCVALQECAKYTGIGCTMAACCARTCLRQ